MGTLNVSGESIWGEQGPGDTLDYSLDWSAVASSSDPIQTSTWSVSPSDLALSNQQHTQVFTSFWASGGTVGTWYSIQNTVVTVSGKRATQTIMLFIKAELVATPVMGSALFPNKFSAIAAIRRDNLMLLAGSIMPDVSLSDDYIWKKLIAAESIVAGMLRVKLQPTKFFPRDPTPEQIAELNGKPWAIDAPYDYDPQNWMGDRWGFTALRQRPVQSIQSVKFVYPSPAATVLNMPLEWVRVDKKYGHMQFVPTNAPFLSPIGGMVMQQMAGGRSLPFAIEVEYVAGIADAAATYPEMVEAVIKMAMIKVVEDNFMPQSGSISADGLSQSMSVDVSKYHDAFDTIMNGTDGANGGLMSRINGVRMAVF